MPRIEPKATGTGKALPSKKPQKKSTLAPDTIPREYAGKYVAWARMLCAGLLTPHDCLTVGLLCSA